MLKLIRQVHLRFAKYFSRKFASTTLTHPQYMMLMSLLEEGAQKMSSLAEFLHISTPAVTNLVDKLERGGYARRLPDASDRRAHIIALTESGRKFIKGLREESLRLLADTIGTLPLSDQKVIEKFYGSLLLRLDAALGKIHPKYQ
jgi:DNA-binding MarR family transcriptional regulator